MGKPKGSSKGKSKSSKSPQQASTQPQQQEPPALAPDGDPRFLRSAAQAALTALPLRTAPPAKCVICNSSEGDWHSAASSVVLPCGCGSHLRCLWSRTMRSGSAGERRDGGCSGSSLLSRCYACPARGCGRSFLPLARVDDRVRVLAGPVGSYVHGRRGRVSGIFTGVNGIVTASVKLDEAWAPDAPTPVAGDARSRIPAHAAVVRVLDVRLDHLQVLDARTDQRHPELLYDNPLNTGGFLTDDELIELLPPRATCGQCGLRRPKDHFSGNQRKRARAENSLPTCTFCVQGAECELRDGVTNERLPTRLPFHPGTELDAHHKGAGDEVLFKVPHAMAPETLTLRRVTNAALQLHRLGRTGAAGTVARDALELSTGHTGDTAQTAAAKARAVLIRSELSRARELQRGGEQAPASEAAKEALRLAQEQLLHMPLEKMIPLRELAINDAESEGIMDDDGYDQEDWWAAQAKDAQSLIDQGSSPRRAQQQTQSGSREGTPSPSSSDRGSNARSGRRDKCGPIQSLNPHEVLKDGKWTSMKGKDSRGHAAYVRWVEKDLGDKFVLEKQKFSISSTPGDLRTRSNELSNLRRKDEGIQAAIPFSVSAQALEAHRRIISAKNDLRAFKEAQLAQEQLLQASISDAEACLDKMQQAE